MKNSAHLKPHPLDDECVDVPGASIFTHLRVGSLATWCPEEVFWFDFAVGSFAGMLFSILAVIFILPVFCVKRKMR